MIRFYHHLGTGLGIDEALREAQLDLLYRRVELPRPGGGWVREPLASIGLAKPGGADGDDDLGHPNRWAAFEVLIGG